jgi:hypothetical protein
VDLGLVVAAPVLQRLAAVAELAATSLKYASLHEPAQLVGFQAER